MRKILLFPAQEKTMYRGYFAVFAIFKYPSNEGV